MRLILFVIFVFGIFNTNLYCKDNIEADAKIFLEDSILTINVTIHNKSDIEIYIPITEWYLEGDFVRNTALPVPQTYLINEIIFYPENSEEPKSVFDAVCDYSTNKMPTLIQVSKDSSVNLTIIKKFNNSKNFFIKDVNYTFELGLSYSDFHLLYEISEILGCSFGDMFLTENQYSFELKSPKSFFNLGYDYCNCCKMDKKRSKILRLGFLNKINFKSTLIQKKK